MSGYLMNILGYLGLLFFLANLIIIGVLIYVSDKRFFIGMIAFLLIPLILYVSYLYYEDYYQMRKAQKEYSLLKDALLPGMDRSEVLKKLRENGYGYYGYKEEEFRSNDRVTVHLSYKSTSLSSYDYLAYLFTGCHINFQRPHYVELNFNDDKLVSIE